MKRLLQRLHLGQPGSIHTHRFWPALSDLMLFLAVPPVSTAGLVHSSSFQTLIDQDTRRRRLDKEHMHENIFMHIHRQWFSSRLDAGALQAVSALVLIRWAAAGRGW